MKCDPLGLGVVSFIQFSIGSVDLELSKSVSSKNGPMFKFQLDRG